MTQTMTEEEAGMKLVEMASAFWTTQHVRTAAALGLADAVADGPRTPEEIAAKVGTVPALTRRLLRTLASQGVFVEDGQGRFGHSPMSKVLESDHPSKTRTLVLYFAHPVMWNGFAAFEHAMRTGENAFTHGNGKSFWDMHNADAGLEQLLADCMTAMAEPMADAIALAYPFGDFDTVVDVGGSNGNLIAAIARAHDTKGILFDLPGVVEAAPAKGYITAPDVADRLSAVGGSAFESVPAGHRCYIAKSVIHDWDDDSSISILKTIARDSAPDARILLAEYVVQPGNAPDIAKLMDLDMLMCNDGQERTEVEFQTLIEGAGLKLNRIIPTAAGPSLVECVKA